MTYVISEPCVDVVDRGCVDACPVEAISDEDDLPAAMDRYFADNEAFFTEVLPGHDGARGSPGGAARLGTVGVDTPLVAGLSPQGDVVGEVAGA